MGVERKLFFLALIMGAAVFNLLHTFLGGILMFLVLYWFARWTTRTDPQILRFLLNSARIHTLYDRSTFTPVAVRRIRRV
jgi:type IV secretory pathway TrbD component